jgi:hypothetical protein
MHLWQESVPRYGFSVREDEAPLRTTLQEAEWMTELRRGRGRGPCAAHTPTRIAHARGRSIWENGQSSISSAAGREVGVGDLRALPRARRALAARRVPRPSISPRPRQPPSPEGARPWQRLQPPRQRRTPGLPARSPTGDVASDSGAATLFGQCARAHALRARRSLRRSLRRRTTVVRGRGWLHRGVDHTPRGEHPPRRPLPSPPPPPITHLEVSARSAVGAVRARTHPPADVT